MQVITKKHLVNNVAARWKKQYYDNGWRKIMAKPSLTSGQIYDKLLIAKTEQDVKDAIGNTSWTKNECHECGLDCDIIVVLGEEPDYESNTAQICPDCIKKAMDLLNAKS